MLTLSRETITQAAFVAMIQAEKACRFIVIRTLTEAQASKAKGATIVLKSSVIAGLINWHYDNAVNNQLEREGKETTFVPQPRRWGVHYQGHLSLIENKGAFYLQVKVERTLRKSMYYIDGARVSKESVAHLLRVSKAPATQDTLEKKIVLRDYAISNMREVRFNGKRFNVV
jgi:hypothetical protein